MAVRSSQGARHRLRQLPCLFGLGVVQCEKGYTVDAARNQAGSNHAACAGRMSRGHVLQQGRNMQMRNLPHGAQPTLPLCHDLGDGVFEYLRKEVVSDRLACRTYSSQDRVSWTLPSFHVRQDGVSTDTRGSDSARLFISAS